MYGARDIIQQICFEVRVNSVRWKLFIKLITGGVSYNVGPGFGVEYQFGKSIVI